MRLKVSATIVHNTNTYQAENIPYHVQQPYFAYLLGNVTFLDSYELQTFWITILDDQISLIGPSIGSSLGKQGLPFSKTIPAVLMV